MARRKSTRLSSVGKIEPAQLTLTFKSEVSPAGIPIRSIIDLSQCASLANRRFYRQGLNWGVAGIKILSVSSGQAWTYKLPNTWVMANAWKKSMSTWAKMNREALAEAPSVKPRFLDFKVFMDSIHHTAGFAGNLLPMTISQAGGLVSPAVVGEWESSKMFIPDTTSATGQAYDRELIAVGGNYPGPGASGMNAVSLIEGYSASRLLPAVLDPNAPDDAALVDGPFPENWISATFNEGTQQTDDVIDVMITENNIAPYPFENDGAHFDTMYPGGANQLVGLQNHDVSNIYSTSATTSTGVARIKGGSFPCGLIAIDWIPDVASNIIIQVDLIPGSHRGYLAEPMQDM
jgi:hypothetical protein